jgi:tetratricopeptide (TPR) repeat protein
MRSIPLKILILVAYLAVYLLSSYIEHVRIQQAPNDEDEMIILDGSKLKGFCLGLNGLFADYYWMQSLQYLGRKIMAYEKDIQIDDLTVLNPKFLYPLLNNSTELDPNFKEVYFFGAVVLPAIDPNDAIKLLEKGIRYNSQDWRFYHYLGFIYWKLGDYEKAASIYEEGSRIPDAPAFMKILVARLRSEGGSRETARAIYQELYEQATSEDVKKTALIRILELDSFDQQDAIRRSLAKFQAMNGRCALEWREILPILSKEKVNIKTDAAGRLYDPTGAPYILDVVNCDVKIDPEKTKLPLR